MTALYIILGIIAFFVILLSIKIVLTIDYDDTFSCSVKWLFLRFSLYPRPEKKPKKEKPKKEEKPKEDKPKGETAAEEKKENPLKTFYNNQGFDGVLQLIKTTLNILKKMTKGMLRAFKFEKLYLRLGVSKGDVAETAQEYGKVCAGVFPAMGYICSNMKVGKYAVDVHPDFITNKKTAEFHVDLSVIPRRLINAVIAAAFRLFFKVLLKILITNRKAESQKSEIKNDNTVKKEKVQ